MPDEHGRRTWHPDGARLPCSALSDETVEKFHLPALLLGVATQAIDLGYTSLDVLFRQVDACRLDLPRACHRITRRGLRLKCRLALGAYSNRDRVVLNGVVHFSQTTSVSKCSDAP